MIANQVRQYIEANTSLMFGIDLFVSLQPDAPDNCVTLYDSGGSKPSVYLPEGNPNYQIIVRNNDYEAGMAVVAELVALLHNQFNLEFVNGETYVYYSVLQGEPGPIGRDSKNRHEWSINFNTLTRR